MAYDLEEQEQLATIKSWWSQYGKLVMVAVVGGLLVVGGIPFAIGVGLIFLGRHLNKSADTD